MEKLTRLQLEDNLLEKYRMKVSQRTVTNVARHWHEFYEIELYLHGTGTMEINGIPYEMRPNTLVMLTPVDFHAFEALPGESISLLSLTFAPDCLEKSSLGTLMTVSQYLWANSDSRTAERLAYLMHRIRQECEEQGPLSLEYAEQLLNCLLIEFMRQRGESRDNPVSQPVQRAVYYLRTHFREPITLEDTARFAGFSPSHMSRMFREYLGVGLKEYLMRLRLNQAEQLMRLSMESVTDVAEYCGFGSISHFLHVFRDEYGCSPMKYRKRLQNGEK